MDPFTAVSLAGNILQFLASAKSVYKQVAEIRSSVTGISNKNEEMLSLATDLQDITDRVSTGINSFQEPIGITEKKIREIGAECQQLAREVQEDIRNRAQKDKTNLLRATTSVIRGSWKVTDAEKKLKRLHDMQKTLFKHLFTHLRYAIRETAELKKKITKVADMFPANSKPVWEWL